MSQPVVKMFGTRIVVSFVFYLSLVRCTLRKDPEYWRQLAANELKEALAVEWNLGVAKNVILFIGDGMGPNTITASRIHKGGEGHTLVYEKFPHVGVLKTYAANKMVPDSTSTATALLCGVKANYQTMGVDASVEHKNCSASLNPDAWLDSLAALALRAGKSAGFVTTMRVTHATPGPMYAHSAARQWECDAALPPAAPCKDIARQLVEDWPGRDLHVILGGGRQGLVPNATGTPSDPISPWACSRADGRDLINQYKLDKEKRGLKYSYVSNTGQLKNIDVDNVDYLLGIFSNAHLPYEFERDTGPEGSPSLVDMTEAAIKVLSKNDKGYFLMVEGGNIDMAHHRGRARTAVHEALALERAVSAAAARARGDTLLVVTADHTHTLSINGYPDRGSNVFGTTGPSKFDNLNYTTLSYGIGGPGSFKYDVQIVDNKTRVVRKNPAEEDTKSFLYQQPAAITTNENLHGGGDVLVYARGPYAHLFHNVHEQHYVFNAISYAAKIGEYSRGFSLESNVAICFTVLLGLLFFYKC